MQRLVFWLCLGVVLVLALTAHAGTALFTWDAVPPMNQLTPSYKLHWGTVPGAYPQSQDMGQATQGTLTLAPDVLWYVAVSAYDPSGTLQESALSAAVSVRLFSSTPIPSAGLRVVLVDSEEVADNGAAANVLDRLASTFWHTQWVSASPPPPHTLVLDLGRAYPVAGWRMLPRQDGSINGRIGQWEVALSPDNVTWGTPITGTFANDPTEKEAVWPAVSARYVRLRVLKEVNGMPWTSLAELTVLQGTPPHSFAVPGHFQLAP